MHRSLKLILVGLILFQACNPEKKSSQQIRRLEESGSSRKYEIGMACMQYILKHGEDLSYSKTLVRKMLALGFAAEGIYAAEQLLKRHPGDADLLCFRGIGYRGLHQYKLALEDLRRAMASQPQNNIFAREAEITAAQQARWIQIQSYNDALTHPVDSFDVLLNRAEEFFAMKEYDAVLYDLGSISKMRAPEDSLYYTQKVSELYTTSRSPVETLTGMLGYFKNLDKEFRNGRSIK